MSQIFNVWSEVKNGKLKMSPMNTYLTNMGHGKTGIGGCPTYGKATPGNLIDNAFEDGLPFFHEGDIVGKIGIRLKEKIEQSPFNDRIKFELLNGYCNIDIPLKARMKYAKFVAKTRQPLFWLGIHINAVGYGGQWHDANGARVLYYGPETEHYAQLLMECHERNSIIDSNGTKKVGIISGGIKMRSHLYELRKTPCPALIYEAAFMTNKKDALRISSDAGIEDATNTLFEFILINEGLI